MKVQNRHAMAATPKAMLTPQSTGKASRHRAAGILLVFGALSFAAATRARAQCVGDCNGDGTVQINELILGVNIALGKLPVENCPAFNPNQSAEVEINELIQGVNMALNGCPSGASPTPTPTSGPGQTPTPRTPLLRIELTSRRNASTAVTLRGHVKRVDAASYPRGRSDSYTQTVTLGASEARSIDIAALGPGTWLHSIEYDGEPQQWRRSLVVSDAGAPNELTWTVFQSVFKVNQAGDTDDGSCDATCTLRTAIGRANGNSWSLVRFDHDAFASGVAEILVDGGTPFSVTSTGTTIDGTDAEGHPSPLIPFTERSYPAVIVIDPSPANNVAKAGEFRIKAPAVELRGLRIERVLRPDTAIGGMDQNLIAFDPGSGGAPGLAPSRVSTCLLDGGAAARTHAACPSNKSGQPPTNPAQGKDCVDAENTGAQDQATAPVVGNSEIRSCYDRAIKSQQSYLVVQDNWIHHNHRGGPFAQSANGTLETHRNLVEANGKNCTAATYCRDNVTEADLGPCILPARAQDNSSCPGSTNDGCGAGATCVLRKGFAAGAAACGDTVVRATAAQIAVESSPSPATSAQGILHGDLLRDGANLGLRLRKNALAEVNDLFICGMDQNGIEVNTEAGTSTDPILVRGTASVLHKNGVLLYATSSLPIADIEFGTDTAHGNNAFAKNKRQGSGRNFVARAQSVNPRTIAAAGNQWESCGIGEVCQEEQVLAHDVSGDVAISPAVAHRNPGTLAIDPGGIIPAKVARPGAVVHIYGRGFDAIDGVASATEGDGAFCYNLAAGNTCSPLSGTCVEFKDPVTNQWLPARDVLAVTPTHLTVTSPIGCTTPTDIRITPQGGEGAVFENVFCKNPG